MGQEDFEKKTLIELQQIGKEIGLKSITKFRKNELIEQIQCYKEQQKKTERSPPPQPQISRRTAPKRNRR